MQIYHNIPALNATRQLGVNTVSANKSLARLSSGLRINGASDDAAGLVISEKMRALVRGLDQATKNAQDGMSMLQTAESALNETHAILDRMYELAIQAANGTLEASDRSEIQKEINQLESEIDRISTDTEFNSKKLLDGSIKNSATVGGTNTAKISSAAIVDDTLVAGDYTIEVSGLEAANVTGFSDNGTNADAVDLVAGEGIGLGSYTITVLENGSNVDVVVTDSDGNEIGAAYDKANTADIAVAIDGGGTLTLSHDGTDDFTAGSVTFDVQASATFTVKSGTDTIGATTKTDTTTGSVNVGGFTLDFTSTLAAGTDTTITVATDAVSFQIGTQAGQNTSVSIADMSANALGVDELDLTTVAGAEAAITALDTAIASVSSERSKLGAVINRLEYTVKNLGATRESTTTAEARIRDADMAKEMMEFTKFNILNQAATAMLAQANQMPQTVLQLLR